MNWELIIFDCDGVLVDSEPIADRIFSKALQLEGVHVPDEEMTALFMGYSIKDCIKRAEKYSNKVLSKNFAQKYYDLLFAEFKKHLKPIPYISSALTKIQYPKCVASSGTKEKMGLTLSLTGLLQEFEGRIFSATDVKHGKPFPDLFLYAAKECNAQSKNCVVIEDSIPGVKAGVAAGMTVFAYTKDRDVSLYKSFDNSKVKLFNSMKELPELLYYNS